MKIKRKNLIIANILLALILIVVTPLASLGEVNNNSTSVDIEIAKVGDDDFSSLTFDYWKVDSVKEEDYKTLAEKYEKMHKSELDKLLGSSHKTLKTTVEDKKAIISIVGLDSGTYLFKLDDTSFSKLKNFYVPAFFIDITKDDKILIESKVQDLSLNLEKVDKYDNTKKLEGVVFELYEYNDGNKDEKKVNVSKKNGLYYIDSQGKDSLITDKNGRIKVYGLDRYKSYYFKEVKTLPNYIVEQKKTNPLRYGGYTIVENKPKLVKGRYKFVKVDSFNQQIHLKGAKFAVSKLDDKDKTYKIVKDGDDDYILTSDDRGEFTTKDLEFGSYRLQEIMPPPGYRASSIPIDFVIDKELTSSNAMGVTFIENDRLPTKKPRRDKDIKPREIFKAKDIFNPNRPPIVKTGDVKIIIFIVLGLIFILIGIILFRREKKS